MAQSKRTGSHRLARENGNDGQAANASLADDIYASLKREILALTIAPQSVLDEAALVNRFGVSRTPVREAIRKLAADGLVELRRHQSAQVKPILLESVSDFFECIRIIQKAVLVLSAARANKDHVEAARAAEAAFEKAIAKSDVPSLPELNIAFHMALAAGAGNSFLTNTYNRVLSEGARLSAIGTMYRQAEDWEARMDSITADHRDMLDALAAKDQKEIAALSDRHIDLFRKNLLAVLLRQDTEGLVGEVSDMALEHLFED